VFIEGHIDREFLRILREAGFDIVWECKSRADALRHGYAQYSWDKKEKDTLARIFIDEDIEDHFMPLLVQELSGPVSSSGAITRRQEIRRHLLPLMIVCENERLRNYAVQELKKG